MAIIGLFVSFIFGYLTADYVVEYIKLIRIGVNRIDLYLLTIVLLAIIIIYADMLGLI